MPSKPKLNKKRLKFMSSHDLCRIGVAAKTGMPHVTPVLYAMDGSSPLIATDYETAKLKILRENPWACILVDDYEPDGANRALMLQGRCEIYETGKEYLRLLKVLFDRFEYYRGHPWGEGESPILRILPEKIVSWGI